MNELKTLKNKKKNISLITLPVKPFSVLGLDFQRIKTRFEVTILNSIFPFLMFLGFINMVILNALSTFECQMLIFKQDTGFGILCFVNKPQALLLFVFRLISIRLKKILISSVDNVIYEHNKSIYLACHASFCQRNSILFIICKQT